MRALSLLVLSIGTLLAGVAIAQTWPGQCLAPAGEMRRHHMEMLRHDRDLAVRDGIRMSGQSLNDCLTCHAVRDAAGVAVSIRNDKHFCNSCHNQVAVRVDCFSCHASTPAAVPAKAVKP